MASTSGSAHGRAASRAHRVRQPCRHRAWVPHPSAASNAGASALSTRQYVRREWYPREHMRALAAQRRIGGTERLPALDVPRDGHEVHVVRVREEEREAVQLGEGERGQRRERAEVQLRDPAERERVCRRGVAVGERDAHKVHVALVYGFEQRRGGREDEVAEEGEEPLLDGAHLVHAREAAECEQVLEREWVA